MSVLILILQSLAAFFIGTFLYDMVHMAMHRFIQSKYKWLRAIGRIHSAHHRFLTANLQIHTQWTRANLIGHVVVEYITEVIGTLMCLAFLPSLAVLFAIMAETALFIAVLYWRGADPHHRPYHYLPSYRGGIYVTAEYHALHHVYPQRFFSGYIKLLDYLLGTAQPLQHKNIVMTGANGALGSQMKLLLEKEGANVTAFKFGVDYDYTSYDKLTPALAEADVLFLCHGSKYEHAQAANCDSFIRLIELFKSVKKRGLLPLEVWAVGSEIEFHPCFGIKKIKVYAQSKRNFAKAARVYFHDRDIQYRHIVHSAFTSQMGRGLMSATFAAKMTLFMLKRGFKYIPISYMGFAYLNYFRFVFNF